MKPEDFTGGVQIRARLTPISAFASLFSLALLVAGCATGPRPLSLRSVTSRSLEIGRCFQDLPHRQLTFLVNCRRIPRTQRQCSTRVVAQAGSLRPVELILLIATWRRVLPGTPHMPQHLH